MTSRITNTTALVEGNPDAGLAMCFPGGIEASERRGQRELVESSVLPTEMSEDRAAYEALGFRFGEPVDGDPLFICADLPHGWSKVQTDHDMWSRILDAKGRPRVAVFYKAAFYDRRAHMRLERRFDTEGVYPDGPRGKRTCVQVKDHGTGDVLWTGGPDAWEEARAWLSAHRPDWADPVSGWADAP